jgi:hypothetical protein
VCLDKNSAPWARDSFAPPRCVFLDFFDFFDFFEGERLAFDALDTLSLRVFLVAISIYSSVKKLASIRMEPAWMKKFSNNTVCNFFYFWFVVYAVFALMALFLTVGTFFSLKKLDFFGVMVVLQPLITLLLATAFMMFYYIICDRSLIAKVSESVVQEGFEGGKIPKNNM